MQPKPRGLARLLPAFLQRRKIEANAAGFDRQALLNARERSRECLRQIADRIAVGMLESEAVALGETILRNAGAEKFWHRVYVRFGENTLLPYGVSSPGDVRLAANDIYFIDIGPVFQEYEGDCGDTFVVGDDAEMERCKRDVRRIFQEVRKHWRLGRVSGKGLYEVAQNSAKQRGWQLNLNVDGHRLSQFPHHVHFRGGLGDIAFAPANAAWVLEIQIRHPARRFGAFYEDLLLND